MRQRVIRPLSSSTPTYSAPSWVWHLAMGKSEDSLTRLPRFHRASPSTALDKLRVG
jgi:hypothetical protein